MDTQWIWMVSKTQWTVPIVGLKFDIPTALLSISQLGETAPLTSWFAQVANLAEDGREEGEPMRDLLLGIWTGTCLSNFPAGRRINQSLSHPAETSIGPEPNFWACVQLTKNELINGAKGHSNSHTGRVIQDIYRPKICWGKSTRPTWKRGRIAGNTFQDVRWIRL